MLSLLHLVPHVRVGGESSEYAAPNSDGTRPGLLAYSGEAEDMIGPSAPSKEPGLASVYEWRSADSASQ